MRNKILSLWVIGIVALLVGCKGQIYQVTASSMAPNFPNGTHVTVIPVNLSELQRGDVIAFSLESSPDEIHIKRLIGLPGDVVTIENNRVSINGEILEEPYVVEASMLVDDFKIELTENEYYVLGDNRPNSYDSRGFGPITSENILGKVSITVWNQLLSRLRTSSHP